MGILKLFLLLLLSSIILFCSKLDEYKREAISLNLYNKHYWHVLLHIRDGVSEIEDRNFFIAKDGNINPKAELIATIESFFKSDRDNNSTICRFPARYYWLKRELNATFPEANCKNLNRVLKKVEPVSVTLIFPSAHINTPASMFGHTFLRINSSFKSKLLSYAVNYSANVDIDRENGITFAFKGVFGGYYGRFSLLPYYEKLKEYRDTEQRDIFEYDLNFTKDETLKIFLHIWELNKIKSRYYFFTNNCSYNILWLLEAGRDSLRLVDRFSFEVIPLETIHLAKEEGLIKSKSYRASKRRVLLKYEELIDKRYIYIPKKIIEEDINLDEILKGISLKQQRYILEASIEYLEYRYIEGEIEKERYLTLFYTLTSKRATLGVGEEIKIKEPPNPLDSHRAVRFKFGVGDDEVSYFGFRPAYHSLDDRGYGFMQGVSIEFLNFELGVEKSRAFVEDITLMGINSITNISSFFKPISWRAKLGWDRYSRDSSAKFGTTIGGGVSFGVKSYSFYTLAEPFLYTNGDSGVGLVLGFDFDINRYLDTNFEFNRRVYKNGDYKSILNFSQGFSPSQNSQILLNYKKNSKEDSLRLYFKYFY
jgi:hypothetical protein